jgi:transposase-like protein
MAKAYHYPMESLTVPEIVAWHLSLIGQTEVAIAQRLGVHRNSISKWRDKVQKFIGGKMDMDTLQSPLHEIYPIALKSLIANLAANDSTVTVAFFKGIGAFVDKNQSEEMIKISDEDLEQFGQRIIDSAAKRIANPRSRKKAAINSGKTKKIPAPKTARRK